MEAVISQAGTVDVLTAIPSIPTQFDEDVGFAIPSFNVLDIRGTAAQGISTSGAASTVTITVADATTISKGVAQFNPAMFSAALGVVSLIVPLTIANGGTAATSFNINGAVISGTTTTSPLTALTMTNGQILIGKTGLPPVLGLPINGNNISWTGGAGTLKADITGTTNHSIQLGNVGGSLTSLGVAVDGAIPIGSTGADPVLATLTAGAGISVTNAAGSITIANTSGGFTWTRVAGTSQAVVKQNGYIATNGALTTFTLPATAAIGDSFQIASEGAGLVLIAQNANQQIFCGVVSTSVGVGGSLASTHRRDTIEIVCTNTDNTWTVVDFVGNWGAT